MPVISLRVSQQVYNEVQERFKKEGFSDKSEYIRHILERHLLMGEQSPEDEWKIKIWTTLGISSSKFDYAFKTSSTIEEFFSKVSNSSKIPLKLLYNPEEVNVTFSVGGEEIFIRKPKTNNKAQMIKEIFDELEEKLFGEFYA